MAIEWLFSRTSHQGLRMRKWSLLPDARSLILCFAREAAFFLFFSCFGSSRNMMDPSGKHGEMSLGLF